MFAILVAAQQKEYRAREEKLPGEPVPQPVAYSHKTHVALGLKCAGCHTMPGEGYLATYPQESFCMGCHTSIKKDSPEIRKLAAFAGSKQPVPWVRIYQVPDIVWFNHLSHAKDAAIGCEKCHGDVPQRDVLFKEKSTSMTACMDCHAASKVSNGCDFCHATQ
ncbi:MAG: cytochrome c3 family protein [Bryobacteraceae bacterium]|nr:cytochrome c3 family protein [Bryobacteraceae bacterium]